MEVVSEVGFFPTQLLSTLEILENGELWSGFGLRPSQGGQRWEKGGHQVPSNQAGTVQSDSKANFLEKPKTQVGSSVSIFKGAPSLAGPSHGSEFSKFWFGIMSKIFLGSSAIWLDSHASFIRSSPYPWFLVPRNRFNLVSVEPHGKTEGEGRR